MADRTLPENITRAISAFDGIKVAANIPDGTPTSEYGDKIRAIEAGGVTRVGAKDVNFYDYDGTLLHAYTIAEAAALAELPSAPSHNRLIFQEWNWTLADIQALGRAVDVGATYTTASGASEFDLTLTVVTGLTVRLRIYNVTAGSEISIDWGDGESATAVIPGLNIFAHTYATIGNYTASVDSTGTYYPYGTTASPYNMFGVTPSYICTAARPGDRCTSVGLYALYNCYSLTSFTIPNSVTSVGTGAFYGCHSIIKYTMLSATPPTLAATAALTNINGICIIEVPVGSLEAYQTATNWATYANYMREAEYEAVLEVGSVE